jgi:hypothetical protein
MTRTRDVAQLPFVVCDLHRRRLVCQVLGLLGNPTKLLPVLNQLLGQLVGLAGGLGGSVQI